MDPYIHIKTPVNKPPNRQLPFNVKIAVLLHAAFNFAASRVFFFLLLVILMGTRGWKGIKAVWMLFFLSFVSIPSVSLNLCNVNVSTDLVWKHAQTRMAGSPSSAFPAAPSAGPAVGILGATAVGTEMPGTPPTAIWAGTPAGARAATASVAAVVLRPTAAEDAGIKRLSFKGTCNTRTIHAIKIQRQEHRDVDNKPRRHLAASASWNGMGGEQC